MSDSDSEIDTDRLGIFAGVLLLAMVLMRLLDAPARPLLQATVLGSSVGLDLSTTNLMLLIILGLSLTGTTSIIRGHPRARQQEVDHWAMFWIVPGLLNAGLAVWLNRIEGVDSWLIGLFATAVLILAGMRVEFRAVDPNARAMGGLQRKQMVLIHLAAVILFSLIYDARSRSLLSATAILIVATLLAARLFWMNNIRPGRVFQYGGIAGLILAQMTWGLNYWRLSGLQGGLFLLMIFYVVVGLLQQHLQGQFDDGSNGRRILVGYGGAAIVMLLLIALVAP